MKLSHLTFGQLYKLSHPTTLMRVTRVYHHALRKAWDKDRILDEPFNVSTAEWIYQGIAARYQPVIDFLRGDELNRMLKCAANAQSVCVFPGANREFRILPATRNKSRGLTLAKLVLKFCEQNGVPARCKVGPAPYGSGLLRFAIHVDTDDWGMHVLEYKSGMPRAAVEKHCGEFFPQIFDWVPAEAKFINPCNWPMHTPDYQEIGKALCQE